MYLRWRHRSRMLSSNCVWMRWTFLAMMGVQILGSGENTAAGKSMNPICRSGACVICPEGAMCISTSEDPWAYRDCIRTTMNQVGWVNGTCATCECRLLTPKQRSILRPNFFTREKMWYHLHISKTGGKVMHKRSNASNTHRDNVLPQELRWKICFVSALRRCRGFGCATRLYEQLFKRHSSTNLRLETKSSSHGQMT